MFALGGMQLIIIDGIAPQSLETGFTGLQDMRFGIVQDDGVILCQMMADFCCDDGVEPISEGLANQLFGMAETVKIRCVKKIDAKASGFCKRRLRSRIINVPPGDRCFSGHGRSTNSPSAKPNFTHQEIGVAEFSFSHFNFRSLAIIITSSPCLVYFTTRR